MNEALSENRKATAQRLGIPEAGIPRHVAIIMDGNGRWATQKGLPRFVGHREGGKRVEPTVLAAIDMGIEALTLYSFSLQNWKRPVMEVDFLMHLFTSYLVGIRKMLMDNNVRLQHLGRLEGLNNSLKRELLKTVELTKNNDGLVLGLALNYGGREEILDAVKSVAADVKAGNLSLDQINEQMFGERLTTKGMPDPDLVIRTSNELRISNYLLWQISYSELCPLDILWPDFSVKHFEQAIAEFANRSRRMGDVAPDKGKKS